MPILPIFLFQNALELHTPNSPDPEAMRVPGLTEEILLEKIVQDSLQGPILLNSSHPATMIQENGRVGALFASKAFVQLIVNPMVGKATNNWGYEIPFMIGTCILLVSAISKCFQKQKHSIKYMK